MQNPTISIPNLATLARLDFSPDEEKKYVEQLPKLVEYVGHLQAVKTDVVADAQPAVPARPDHVTPSPERDAILAAAPERVDDYWKVKAVF